MNLIGKRVPLSEVGVPVLCYGQQASYESLCGRCYIEKVGPVKHA